MDQKHIPFRFLSAALIFMLAVSIAPPAPAALAQPAQSFSVYLPFLKEVNPLQLGNLGTLKFTLDTARKASGVYHNDNGNGLYFSVTDAQGFVWQLSVPAGSLLWTQTISMTPFASLDPSHSLTSARSGVLLEPDGLQFASPVTLAVIPPASLPNPGVGLIFSLNQDGSNLGFAYTGNYQNKASAFLFHFSAAAYDDGYDAGQDLMDLYVKMAIEEYQLALDAAKQFIKKGAPPAPVPPAISQLCRGTEVNREQGETYEYMHNFLDPYSEIVYVLLSAIRNLQLLGNPIDSIPGEQAAMQVLKMAETSILTLGNQYKAEQPPDRLPAVIGVALDVERQIELLGGSADILPQITGWAASLRDYYLTQLKTKHEYRAFPIVINLDRMATLLGAADRLEDIMNAMTFEVVMDTSFDATWDHGSGSYESGHVEQQADVKNIKNTLTPPDFLWGEAGNLTLKYTKGNYTVHFNSTTEFYTLDAGQSVVSNLYLKNWDACVTKTFDVQNAGLFGTTETYTSLGGKTRSSGVAQASGQVSFKDYYLGGWLFSVPMVNLSPNLGEKTFPGSGSVDNDFNSSATVHFIIKHTPQ